MTTTTTNLYVNAGLDWEARAAFIADARVAIAVADSAGTKVTLDCSKIEASGPVDDAVIGMLVTLARAAQRCGSRVTLLRCPRPMREQMTEARVASLFDYRR